MNKLFESYDINYDLQGTKYIFKNPNKLFEDNLEYKFGSQYSRVFMNDMVDTYLYGKVMLFKNKLSNKEWQDIINEYGYDMMKNYNLNFKFNEGVICIYIPAFEYETIKDLFQKFSLKFNMTF